MSCRLSEALILSNCKDFAVGGNTGRIWIINRADWLAATVTVETGGEISAIVPVSPEVGEQFAYRYEVPQASIITGYPLTHNTGISGLLHSVTFLRSDMSMAMKDAFASFININRCLIIVETQAIKAAVPAESKSPPYILFGLDYGLSLSALDGNLSDQASGGSPIVTLSTPPEGGGLELAEPTNLQLTTAEIVTLEDETSS